MTHEDALELIKLIKSLDTGLFNIWIIFITHMFISAMKR